MLKINNHNAFVNEIKKLDESLNDIKLHNIEIDRESLTIKYHFISDKTVSDVVKNKMIDYIERQTPEVFKYVDLDVSKIVSDPELIANSIYFYIKNNFPSVSMWLEKSDITIDTLGIKIKYTIDLVHDAKEYFESSDLLKQINDYLYTNFCSVFIGEIKEKFISETYKFDTSSVYLDAIDNLKIRTFSVSDVVVIDDKDVQTVASYMQDATEAGNVTLAGTITNVREKEAKNGKPFFIIDFTDTTAKMTGVYFTKKNTLDKIRTLCIGDDIICKGKLSYYGEKGLSLTIDKINKCTFPEEFVAEDLPIKKAPLYYTLIKPKPAEIIKVKGILEGEKPLPQEVLSTKYVSVDIETTGLNPISDVITEIGAVKIVNGAITETWSTLVDPQRKLDAKNIALTGITDEMLQGQPLIEDVFGDFALFCDGCTVVGHNMIEFDSKFLESSARKCGYEFDKKYEDTLFLAPKLLPELRRYKLNVIADHFGIEFRHHRALSDAMATAEVFLELKKIEKSLEK